MKKPASLTKCKSVTRCKTLLQYTAKYLISFRFGLVLSGLSLLALSIPSIFTILVFNVLQLDLLERTVKPLHTNLR